MFIYSVLTDILGDAAKTCDWILKVLKTPFNFNKHNNEHKTETYAKWEVEMRLWSNLN